MAAIVRITKINENLVMEDLAWLPLQSDLHGVMMKTMVATTSRALKIEVPIVLLCSNTYIY